MWLNLKRYELLNGAEELYDSDLYLMWLWHRAGRPQSSESSRKTGPSSSEHFVYLSSVRYAKQSVPFGCRAQQDTMYLYPKASHGAPLSTESVLATGISLQLIAWNDLPRVPHFAVKMQNVRHPVNEMNMKIIQCYLQITQILFTNSFCPITQLSVNTLCALTLQYLPRLIYSCISALHALLHKVMLTTVNNLLLRVNLCF